MGWFDKKSWQLRQKIKDLQSELAAAERDGKYVVEQGLFFAELEEMGNATMMVLGTADHLAAQEEAVIRSFFDRNGFTVEIARLDKTQTALAEVEIIPPEELTRHVARILKSNGFRMVDDSERERPADLEQKIFPLSAVVRSISALFAEHVHNLIISTHIKMNMEGNRLLHWMPLIVGGLEKKVERPVIEQARDAFWDGYHHYYSRFGHLPDIASHTSNRMMTPTEEAESESTMQIVVTTNIAASDGHPIPSRHQTPTNGWEFKAETPQHNHFAGKLEGSNTKAVLEIPHSEARQLRISLDTALTMAKLYKSLIGANPKRAVRNASLLLEEINRYFEASSACVLVKTADSAEFTCQAEAGLKIAYGENSKEGYPVSTRIVEKSLTERAPVGSEMGNENSPSDSMIANSIESAAAAPIVQAEDFTAVLYVDRRENLKPFTQSECSVLGQFAEVFREFPDLLLKQR